MNKFDQFRKKTFTPFWNNFDTKPKSSKSMSLIVQSLKKFFKKNIGIQIKINTYKNLEKKDEFFSSYQIDKNIITYRNKLLSEIVVKYLRKSDLIFKIKVFKKGNRNGFCLKNRLSFSLNCVNLNELKMN